MFFSFVVFQLGRAAVALALPALDERLSGMEQTPAPEAGRAVDRSSRVH